jgi:hypothetical protein
MAEVFALEKHYTAEELADLWHLDSTTVRRIFQDQPGVLKIGNHHRRGKRAYVSLRIPESLAKRFHDERSR